MERRSFGGRVALVAEVMMSAVGDPSCRRMEATPAGWLFLSPIDGRRGVLQVVVPGNPVRPLERLIELVSDSRLVGGSIDELCGPPKVFAAAPALSSPLQGSDWLPAGHGAMSLDPLCGDGTGFAVRIALLASGVIGAATPRAGVSELREHYAARLLRTFQLHLDACRSFYTPAVFDQTWGDEIECIRSTASEFSAQLATQVDLRFGMKGFDLVRL